MKTTMKSIALSLAICLSTACIHESFAQWATNGNNASGASPSTPNEFVGTLNNFNLNFKTNANASSTVRMTLTPSGFLGIGTTAPASRLDVIGGNINTSGVYKIANKQIISATTTTMRLGGSTMKVGINNNTPIFRLDVTGGSVNTDSMYRINGRIVINSSGTGKVQVGDNTTKVGIGTASPGFQMHIINSGYANMAIQSSGGGSRLVIERGTTDSSAFVEYRTIAGAGAAIWQTGTDTNGFDYVIKNVTGTSFGPPLTVLRSNNNIGIGTGTPAQKFVVYNQTTTGSYTTTGWAHSSDARLKTKIVPLENSLEKIIALHGVSYYWNNQPEDNKQIGFIAQEVEKVFPEVIVKDSEGNYSMVPQNLTAPIIEAIKEQQLLIEEKDKKIEALTEKLEQFELALLQNGIISEKKQSREIKNKDIAFLGSYDLKPGGSNASVNFYLPDGSKRAMITLYSANGALLQSIPVSANGHGTADLSVNLLSAGTYTCRLMLDGKMVDSKHLVIIK